MLSRSVLTTILGVDLYALQSGQFFFWSGCGSIPIKRCGTDWHIWHDLMLEAISFTNISSTTTASSWYKHQRYLLSRVQMTNHEMHESWNNGVELEQKSASCSWSEISFDSPSKATNHFKCSSRSSAWETRSTIANCLHSSSTSINSEDQHSYDMADHGAIQRYGWLRQCFDWSGTVADHDQRQVWIHDILAQNKHNLDIRIFEWIFYHSHGELLSLAEESIEDDSQEKKRRVFEECFEIQPPINIYSANGSSRAPETLPCQDHVNHS